MEKKPYRTEHGRPLTVEEIKKFKPIAIMLISVAKEQGLDAKEFDFACALARQIVFRHIEELPVPLPSFEGDM